MLGSCRASFLEPDQSGKDQLVEKGYGSSPQNPELCLLAITATILVQESQSLFKAE